MKLLMLLIKRERKIITILGWSFKKKIPMILENQHQYIYQVNC